METAARTNLRTTLVITVALVLAAVRCASAQDTISTARIDSMATPFDGWMIGASVGVPGYGNQPLPDAFTVGLSFTYLRPRTLGADFSIGTMPRAISSGVGVAGARADLVLPLPLTRDVVLLPGAGVSAIGAAGRGGSGGLVGFNAGLSAIVAAGPVGLRVGATFHQFADAGGPIWLIEMGVVDLPNLGTHRRR